MALKSMHENILESIAEQARCNIHSKMVYQLHIRIAVSNIQIQFQSLEKFCTKALEGVLIWLVFLSFFGFTANSKAAMLCYTGFKSNQMHPIFVHCYNSSTTVQPAKYNRRKNNLKSNQKFGFVWEITTNLLF